MPAVGFPVQRSKKQIDAHISSYILSRPRLGNATAFVLGGTTMLCVAIDVCMHARVCACVCVRCYLWVAFSGKAEEVMGRWIQHIEVCNTVPPLTDAACRMVWCECCS